MTDKLFILTPYIDCLCNDGLPTRLHMDVTHHLLAAPPPVRERLYLGSERARELGGEVAIFLCRIETVSVACTPQHFHRQLVSGRHLDGQRGFQFVFRLDCANERETRVSRHPVSARIPSP
ncbi:hypothetical protein ACFO0A_00630 [Novosphingobium tardum]|uniref:Uncharacterized protein n=1 Tax=Novosphingobium tardum TaxID=1538021 RepID=A0ABV8RJK7_9SPHN